MLKTHSLVAVENVYKRVHVFKLVLFLAVFDLALGPRKLSCSIAKRP